MKTLIVKYTPREGSNTAILVEETRKILEKVSEVKILDLVKNPPDLFLEANLNAYVKKHLHKKELETHENNYLKKMYEFTDQVIEAENIIIAFPIYNFSMPAAIKAWLDSILLAGKTFRYTEYGPEGLLQGKKFLIINTSDGTKPFSSRDFSSPYLKEIFNFMGVQDFKVSGLFGIKYTGIVQEKLEEFKNEVIEFFKV